MLPVFNVRALQSHSLPLQAVLAAILLLGLLAAALMPMPAPVSSGVQLEGVTLQLYPAQDPQAQWRFTARNLSVSPSNEHTLTGLGTGERWVTAAGTAARLDMTIAASTLTIDAQDNLKTPRAALYMLSDCSTFTLWGTPQQPVTINQLGGYTAPRGRIESPMQSGSFRDISANFDFSSFQAKQEAGMELHTAPQLQCAAGRVTRQQAASQQQSGGHQP